MCKHSTFKKNWQAIGRRFIPSKFTKNRLQSQRLPGVCCLYRQNLQPGQNESVSRREGGGGRDQWTTHHSLILFLCFVFISEPGRQASKWNTPAVEPPKDADPMQKWSEGGDIHRISRHVSGADAVIHLFSSVGLNKLQVWLLEITEGCVFCLLVYLFASCSRPRPLHQASIRRQVPGCLPVESR